MAFELRFSTALLGLILAVALPGCGGSAHTGATANAETLQSAGLLSAGAFDPQSQLCLAQRWYLAGWHGWPGGAGGPCRPHGVGGAGG
jgi:hypothetical protein